ncbi:MAG: ferredoxin reductase, partial [Actinomycetota bacterium]|nr:ferredoxin reductase [Actinomycetota bacterium]
MAERGATPQVSPTRRRALNAVRSLFSPLLPDDYLELINPLWSTRELRGRIEHIRPERGNAVTIAIRPGHAWPGHRPGQYLRVG